MHAVQAPQKVRHTCRRSVRWLLKKGPIVSCLSLCPGTCAFPGHSRILRSKQGCLTDRSLRHFDFPAGSLLFGEHYEIFRGLCIVSFYTPPKVKKSQNFFTFLTGQEATSQYSGYLVLCLIFTERLGRQVRVIPQSVIIPTLDWVSHGRG